VEAMGDALLAVTSRDAAEWSSWDAIGSFLLDQQTTATALCNDLDPSRLWRHGRLCRSYGERCAPSMRFGRLPCITL
jgi:hypothetical protein